MKNSLTLTTELEAINLMLASIGEAPVSQLDESTVDVSNARQILRATSREIQAEGWHFNTELELTLVPNEKGEIQLPHNTLSVDTSGSSADLDLVQRGLRFYDRAKHSYKIGRSVTVDIIILLDFEELPENARVLITETAGLRFQDSAVGSDLLHKFSAMRADRARAMLQAADSDTGDYNMLTGCWSALSATNRRLGS